MNKTSTRLDAWLQKGLAGQGKSLEEFSSCAPQDKNTLLVSIIRSTKSRYGKKKLTKKSFQNLFSNLKKHYAVDIMYDENYLQAKNAFEEYIKSTQEKISNLKRPSESSSEEESKKALKIRLSRCYDCEEDWNSVKAEIEKLDSPLIDTLIDQMESNSCAYSYYEFINENRYLVFNLRVC